jgi:peptidoglycan lytic transglycosylase
MSSRNFIFGLAVASLVCSACGRRRPVARVPVPVPVCCSRAGGAATSRSAEDNGSEQRPAGPGYSEVGYASWYGDPYHGRRAANGEIYDKNQLTAAHLTLPFGTQVKVTDLENNRSVEVRINDRGPFVKGRIVDLSLAAARQIQMVGPGTALVRLDVVSMPAEPELGEFAVQVGAFRDRSTAERLRERLLRRYGNVTIQNYESSDGVFYRVRVGPKATLSGATELASRLGRESLSTFVVRIDN